MGDYDGVVRWRNAGGGKGESPVTTPFLGEIRMYGFNFAPRGWAACDGQVLSISQNSALFALLGTMYGGNGQTTFALPDLRGRAPIHVGQGPGLSSRVQGQQVGEEQHTLIVSEVPLHNHSMRAAGVPTTGTPASTAVLAAPDTSRLYRSGTSPDTLLAPTIMPTGGNQPHLNMQPFTVVNFSIALQGIFPSRN